MNIFEVYHATTPTFMDTDPAFLKETFPMQHTFVARVATDDVHRVYQLTNHIDRSWLENPEVTPGVTRARSTSVGDVFIDRANGKGYVVNSIGLGEWTL